jgi:hypothetical protein
MPSSPAGSSSDRALISELHKQRSESLALPLWRWARVNGRSAAAILTGRDWRLGAFACPPVVREKRLWKFAGNDSGRWVDSETLGFMGEGFGDCAFPDFGFHPGVIDASLGVTLRDRALTSVRQTLAAFLASCLVTSGASIAAAETDEGGSAGVIGDASLAAMAQDRTQEPHPFQHQGDYVHTSANNVDASAHGWWTTNDQYLLGKTGTVTVELQYLGADGQWRTVVTGPPRSIPPNQTAKRANARIPCRTTTPLGDWRSVVDVDIDGVIDDSNVLITAVRPLPCHP